MADGDAELRARLNEELGFYPASLDPASIAEYRREAAEEDGLPCIRFSPAEEIERWCLVTGTRGSAAS
jgi:hypothetical protein